jgi:hypothetical protein
MFIVNDVYITKITKFLNIYKQNIFYLWLLSVKCNYVEMIRRPESKLKLLYIVSTIPFNNSIG